MGNSNQLIGSQLKFIQNIQDPRFGQIDIYQNDEGRFLMKTVKTHIYGDRRHNQFKRMLEWLQNQQSKLIVPIINRSDKHEKNICVQYEITTLYMEYYNYTLKDLIMSKKDLEESQLWFVLVQMLNLVILLKQKKIGINLDIDNVFLTLKGHPTVYAYHLLSFQDTICANQFGMGQLIARIMLQLANLQIFTTEEEQGQKQMLVPLAKLCNKNKLMGRMVRELLYRERPQVQILEELMSLHSENKIKKANQIKLIKFKYMIPQKKDEVIHKNNEKDIVQHSIGFKNTNKRKASTQRVQFNQPPLPAIKQKQHKEDKAESHLDKDVLQKMLAEINQKKKLNLQKMQKFQQKKDELIQNSVRNQDLVQSVVRKGEGKENNTSKNNFRKSQKKAKPQKQRRATQGVSTHYHIR